MSAVGEEQAEVLSDNWTSSRLKVSTTRMLDDIKKLLKLDNADEVVRVLVGEFRANHSSESKPEPAPIELEETDVQSS